MGRILEALHALQLVETQLGKLRREESEKTRLIRADDRQINRINEQMQELRTMLAAREAEARQLEQQVKARDESVSRHREALLQARTNKDYAAILSSINTEKADSTKIEKVALERMTEVEKLQGQVAAELEKRRDLERRREGHRLALQEYLDQTRPEREELERQKQEAATDVSATALATFTRVAEKHDGEAMVEVVRLHPKREDYACGGCNMTVTLERVAALQSRDEIQYCGVCGRILYMPVAAEPKAR